MHFKHPELLYALFLLLIPLVVHLFQLRRFQREDFTNVKFLKKISRETRQSSRLKKWLVLISRMLALAALVFAFARPYVPQADKTAEKSQKLFYLDNSFSMQAMGRHGELLPAAVQALLENLPADEQFTLITNNKEYPHTNLAEIRSELQQTEYAPKALNFKDITLRTDRYFKKNTSAPKEVILISDFQENFKLPAEIDTSGMSYDLLVQRPANRQNFSIDTAFVKEETPEDFALSIGISSNATASEPIAVSIFDGERLLAKASADLQEKNSDQMEFRLKESEIGNGRIEIEDNSLQYDNRLYFSINKDPEIQVVVVSEAKSDFLKKIFTRPEFSFYNFQPRQIDYNQLNSANLIILNEITNLSPTLAQNLRKLTSDGAFVVIIPSEKANLNDYNSFLRAVDSPALQNLQKKESLLTEIAFDDPLYSGVFEGRVENFEYPQVQSKFELSSPVQPVLSFQDNSPFLVRGGQIFLFTAALNDGNTNFKRSPLVVPSFYNMGLQALKRSQLYYDVGKASKIDIPVTTGKDEVLKLESPTESFIPQQRVFSDKVEITTDEDPTNAGNFSVIYKGEKKGNISFNYNRSESTLNYADLTSVKNANIETSIGNFLSEKKGSGEIDSLWKVFVIFALFFLILEMLLLKYLK
ncbi:MAG: BatA domain-containing protein [Salegentibacter sp.]